MKQLARRMPLILACLSVCALTACTGISQPVNVSGLKAVLGNSLPGAQGLTEADQTRIDRTVARGCAVSLYDRAACERHTYASRDRRAVLAQ